MSREIDERVVQMKFEKGQFEKDIQTSIHNLDELKKGLDFKNATKGFDELDKAARNTDISALGRAAEQVQVKFGMLEVFALRVMTRISDAAINAGEKLVKSLTIDQVSPGWDKYAKKTSSVQTIMAATANQFSDTAEQMEVVNAQLNKLNWFTDETSYNFVDMVNNIGKFTSNNIALDQSVTAMQGIANWAAISGANANEASRAMYNLAQALSTGTVKLIDWKSIENANMATTEFKQTVIEIAEQLGTLKKTGEGTWKTLNKGLSVSVSNFNEALSEGWFTNDVLMTALNKYGAAAEKINEIYETLGSEVTTSRITKGIDEYISALNSAREEIKGMDLSVEEANKRIADSTQEVAKEIADEWGVSLEEATKMLNEFDDATMQFGLKAFKAAQEAKTFEEAISSVKDAVSTGWMKTFEIMFGDYTHAKELWTNLANTLYDIFAAGGDARNEMLEIWAKKGGRDYFVDTIYASLAAIMSILTPIKAAWEAVFGKMTAERLLEITKSLHSFVLSLIQTDSSMSKLTRVFRGLFSVLDIIKTVITQIVKSGFKVFQRVMAELNVDVGEFAAKLGDGLFELRNWVKQSDAIPVIFEKIGDVLVWVIQEAKNFIAAIQEFGPVQAIIQGISSMFTSDFQGIGGILTAIGHTFLWLWEQFKAFKMPTSLTDITQFFKDFWEALKDNFHEIGVNLEWVDGLFSNFAASVWSALGSVNSAFNTTTSVVGAAIQYLGGLLSKIDWSGVLLAAFGVGTLAILWKFTEALQGFAGALKNVTQVGKSAQGALDSIKGYFNALKDNIKANSIVKIAAAIIMLAVAFALLSRLSWEEIGKGTIVIGALAGALLALSLVFTVLNKVGFNAKGLSSFLASLGSAVLLLAIALRAIPEDIGVFDARVIALAEVVAVLSAAIIAMSVLTKGAQFEMKGLLALSASIFLLITVMKSIGEEDVLGIYAATPVVAALMLTLGVIAKLLTYQKSIVTKTDNDKTVIKNGGAFASTIGVVLGLMVMISAIRKLGEMDVSVALQGIILMIPTVILLGQLFKAAGKAGQYASSAGKMIFFLAAGLAILRPVVEGFAKMDINTLVKGGLAIIALNTFIMLPLVAVSKFAGQNAAKAGLMVLEIAGALAIIQLVIKTLGRVDLVSLAKGVVSVGVVILALSVAIAAMNEGMKADTNSLKALTKMTIIVGIISALIFLLSIINPTGALAVCGGIAAVFVSLAILFNLMNGIKLPKTTELAPILATVILLGVIVGILGAITDWKGALAVSVGMAGVILALAAVTQILKNSATSPALLEKLKTLQKFAFAMSGVIAILAGTMALYRYFTKETGGQATDILVITTAISELVIASGILGKLLGKLSLPTTRQIGSILIFAGIMSAIVAVLGLLTGLAAKYNLDISNLLMVTTAISEVMLAMGAAIAIMSVVPNPDGVVEKIVAMGVVVSAISIVLGIVMAMVKDYDVYSMLAFTTGLSEVLIALGISVAIMGITDYEMGIAQAAAMSLLVIAIGGVLGLLANFSKEANIDAILPFALGMSVVLLAVGAAAAICAAFPTRDLVGSLETIGVMAVIAVAIIALVAIVGAISQWTGTEIFASAGDAFIGIGRAIGGFFGGIISGFGEGLMSGLPGMMQSVSDGMHNLMPFFEDLNQIPGGALGLVGTLVAVVGAITASQFLSGLKLIPGVGALLAVGSVTLVSDFALFGLAIKAFSDAIEGVNVYKVKMAAEAVSALATLEQSMSGIGAIVTGILGSIFGSDNLEKFGARLASLGSAMIEFQDSVVNLKTDVVNKAAACAEALIALEKGLPPKGGVLQAFLGQDGFDQFGQRLSDLGFALRMFSMYAAMVDPTAVENGRAASESLVKLEQSLEPVSGFTGLIFGTKDISKFGERLTSFGTALSTFSQKVTGLRPLEFVNVVQITSKLIEVENMMDAHGGLKGMIFGDGSFDDFGKGLKTFGDSLALFSQYVSQVNFDRIYTAISYMKMLIGLQEIGEVQTQVVAAAKDILKIIKDTIDADKMAQKARGTSIVKWIADGFENGITVHGYIIEDAAKKIAKKFVDTFEEEMKIHSPSLVMNEEGHWVVKGLAEGIDQETAAEEAIAKKAQNLVSAFESAMDEFSKLQKTANLEFELWQLTEGKGASEAEILARQRELDIQAFTDLVKTAAMRKSALDAITELVGEGTEQWRNANDEWLQAQIDYLNKQNELNEKYGSESGSTANDPYAQMRAFAAWQKENAQAYEMLGYSAEKLQDDAFKAVYGLTGEQIAQKKEYEQIISDYEETFQLLDKSREELEAFARDKSGWQGLPTQVVNDVMAETNQIIQDNISSYTLDMATTLDMAQAEIIENTKKKESKSSKAAGSAGKSLGGDLATGIGGGLSENLGSAITQAISGGSSTADLGGLSALNAKMEQWLNPSSLLSNSIDSIFDKNTLSQLGGKIEGITDVLYGAIVENSNDAWSTIQSAASEYGIDYIVGIANSITDPAAQKKFYNSIQNGVLGPLTDTVTDALGIHSPSTVAFGYGSNYMEGFANGLEDNLSLIEDSMNDMVDIIKRYTDYAQSLINSVLNSMSDMSPTITPVIDMDSIKKQVSSISTTVSGGLSSSTSKAIVNSISSSKSSSTNQNGIAGVPHSTIGTTNYNFTQNNYSPKALSRTEIYRQTSNQFSQIKEATKR